MEPIGAHARLLLADILLFLTITVARMVVEVL